MSIQTQLNRINQGVADQAAIMEQIKDALQGKGSSGGGTAVAYIKGGIASTSVRFSPNPDALRNFDSSRIGAFASSMFTYPIPIGWYVSFPTEQSGFPFYIEPASSGKFIETFTSTYGTEYHLVEILGDFSILWDD